MRKLIPFALLALAAVGPGCARPTAPNAPSADVLTGDAKKLQGMWAVVSVEDGRIENLTGEAKKDAEAMMREVRLVFDGTRMTIIERGEDEPVPFALDEAKAPKVMTLTLGGAGGGRGGSPTTAARAGTFRSGTAAGTSRSAPTAAARPSTAAGTPRSGTPRGTAPGGARADEETWRWIYKLEGDSLVIAFVKDNKALVPTEFKARAGSREPGQPVVPGVTVITLKRTDERPPTAGGRFGTPRGGTSARVGTAPYRPATSK